MATRALTPTGLRNDLRPVVAARLTSLVPWAAAGLLSLVELALADRKFGIFTGGFGVSRAVDRPAEIALFLAGFAAAQALAGVAGWWLAVRITRGRSGWTPAFVFIALTALFAAILAARYQLASYFSDAAGFALFKQLGGGSLADALLFGLSELGLALLALAGAALLGWLAWRALARLLPDDLPRPAGPSGRVVLLTTAAVLVLAPWIQRSGSDAAYGLQRTLTWSSLVAGLDRASDFDRDGYGLVGLRHDPFPFDPTRHPLALDVPGNGIDEDGYGGDLALVPLPEPLGPQRFAGRRPHVVVVVLESTRGDVLGKRIGGQAVAPNLEALAASGAVARPAYSHVGFTTESLKSLFSGQLVPRDGDPSLFRDLKASGYRIGVYSGQPEDFGGISQAVGMRAAADVHIDAETLREKRAFDFAAQGSLRVDESHLLAAFDRTLGSEDWSASPHFAYFNFQSPHFPYDHPGVARHLTDQPVSRGAISASNAARVRDTYWNAVANADRWLGQVIARLKAKGVWDDTILIVSGDHGEELFEGGFLGHGHVINPQQFATLLVANRPGVLPQGPIGLSDYRAILASAIRGAPAPEVSAPPFLHIGALDTPTAIGLAGPGEQLTSLRLDTGEACLVERRTCAPFADLTGEDRRRVDALVARWGSERWREHQRR